MATAALIVCLPDTAFASSEIEGCFTAKLNAARTAQGIAPLITRGDLVSIARRQSQRMANAGEIFHNPNLASEAPGDWQAIGENVGQGPECDDIHRAFMASAPHRKNILDATYNRLGIGVVVAADSTIYVTQIFLQTAGSDPAPAPPPKPKPPPRSVPKPSPSPAPPPPGSRIPVKTLEQLNEIEREDIPTEEELKRFLGTLR